MKRTYCIDVVLSSQFLIIRNSEIEVLFSIQNNVKVGLLVRACFTLDPKVNNCDHGFNLEQDI